MRREKKEKLSKSAASGTVALVFLILGFQIAVFVMKVVERPAAEAVAVATDSAGVAAAAPAASAAGEGPQAGARAGGAERRKATASPPQAGGARTRLGGYAASAPASARPPRRPVESFPFDPNTVSLEDLQRLGLSLRQAESIDNYRSKGGKFRRKSDFKKMYVVSDTLYSRLEPYIEIHKLELNAADSAALTTLRGIGPYYARKIVAYRKSLGGFYSISQLLEIDGFDEERLAGFAEDLTVDSTLVRKIELWNQPVDSLARHPYIRRKGADAIDRFKSVYDSAQWTLSRLSAEHVLPASDIARLRPYL